LNFLAGNKSPWSTSIFAGILDYIIGGAAIGGYLYPGHGMMTWVVAILAAVVLLFLFEMMRKKK